MEREKTGSYLTFDCGAQMSFDQACALAEMTLIGWQAVMGSPVDPDEPD